MTEYFFTLGLKPTEQVCVPPAIIESLLGADDEEGLGRLDGMVSRVFRLRGGAGCCPLLARR